MKVLSIQYKNNNKQKIQSMSKKNVSAPLTIQNNEISNVCYKPFFTPNFKGLTLETEVIQKIAKKKFQGLDIYTQDKNFIDFLKVGYEKLATAPIDIVKATDKEIIAHRFSLALAETYAEGSEFGTDWVRRYNPENRRSPLAVSHFLNDDEVKEEVFYKNLEMLSNPNQGKSLDIPITDKNGNLCLDAVIFDTETTGTKIFRDKIVQIGAIRLKGGKSVKDESGVYNKLINPEMPIPEEASAVNGITDEMVQNAPTIDEVLDDFLGKFMNKQNGIIVTWNGVKFDIPLLNRNIREHNIFASTDLKEKQQYKVIDAQILHQRIHPFLGAKKKLAHQFHWLFCKPMEDAHDALADVKGTLPIFKYDLYWLSKHRIDKSKPLTLRQVLAFQNGSQNVPNLNVPLSTAKNFNALFKFDESYRPEPLDITNYFRGYKLTKKIISEIADQVGPNNVIKLENAGIMDDTVGKVYKGHTLNAPETEKIPNSKKYKSLSYIMKENFKKVIEFAKLEPYNGKSKEEIENLIQEKSKLYINEKTKEIWIKNVNPKDIKQGNDLPDDEITRRVMQESKEK